MGVWTAPSHLRSGKQIIGAERLQSSIVHEQAPSCTWRRSHAESGGKQEGQTGSKSLTNKGCICTGVVKHPFRDSQKTMTCSLQLLCLCFLPLRC